MRLVRFNVLFLILIFNFSISKSEAASKIISYTYNNNQDSYDFQYETSDGTWRIENASLDKDKNLVVVGAYKYIGPDGITYMVRYTADKNGYRPKISQIEPSDDELIDIRNEDFDQEQKSISSDLLGSLIGIKSSDGFR